MSAIFLSHSSRDAEAAALVLRALGDWGYRSVFLDFDPAAGIPPGRQWERELYAQLRSCRAVIVLCSEASMASPWCFAEITHAKALGKLIFPIKVAPCEITGLLMAHQVLDLVGLPPERLPLLRRGLQEAGLDARAMFAWQRDRPPYPGLQAFDREDAGVYFGREPDIQALLEKLNLWQRLPGPRLALVVGASGGGKSSLVRAGVLPRLAQEPARWFVTEPFRPQGQPVERLAVLLESELRQAGVAQGWREIAAVLRSSDESARRGGLSALLTDLRSATGRLAATLVVTVDQAEELFALTPLAEAQAFLAALKTLVELPGNAALALATLRSDYLGAWQQQPAAGKPASEAVLLEPMEGSHFAECIEKPALLAGIELEPGLVQAMVADTGTQDALPLLAFALNAMWRKTGASGQLSLSTYRDDLGGVHGAIARAADAVLHEAGLAAPAEASLKRAFSAMARVNDSGEFVRRTALLDDLAAEVLPWLERFAAERLLVFRADAQGRRTVEVAHEALFRSWARLRGWLDEDREFLLWRRRLEAAIEAWRAAGKDPSLAWRDAPLAQAERWLAERGDAFDAGEREFIAAGVAQRQAGLRRRRQAVGALVAGLAGALALAGFAATQWRAASDRAHQVAARELARAAEVAYDESPQNLELSTLLAIESLKSGWTIDAFQTLQARLSLLPPPPERVWKAHEQNIVALAVSGDGRWVASSDKKDVAVWDVESGKELRRLVPTGMPLGKQYVGLALSPDHGWLAAGCNQVVCLWNTSDWRQSPELRVEKADQVWSLAFTRGGTALAAAGYHAPGVPIFDVAQGTEIARVDTSTSSGSVFGLAADAPGRWLATATMNGLDRWEFPPEGGGTRRETLAPAATGVALSDTGDAWSANANDVKRWPHGETAPSPLKFARDGASDGPWNKLSLSPDARYLASAPDGRVWNAANAREVMLIPGGAPAQTIAKGNLLISANGPSLVLRRLARAGGAVAALAHDSPVGALEVSADGRTLASASGAGVRRFDVDTWAPVWNTPVEGGVAGVRVGPGGKLIAAWQGSRVLLFDGAGGRLLHEHQAGEPVQSLVFSPEGDSLAVVLQRVPATLLATAPPYRPIRLAHSAKRVRFSPDGKWLATYSDAACTRGLGITWLGLITVWNPSTGERVAWRSRETGPFMSGCSWTGSLEESSPLPGEGGDQNLLTQAAQWETATPRGSSVSTHDGHLVPSGDVGRFDLQELASGRRVVTSDADDVLAAALTPDGRWRLTAHKDGVLRVWALDAADLVDAACARLARNLSLAEWHQHLGGAAQGTTCQNLPLGAAGK